VRLSVVIPALNEANRVVDAIESARAPGVEVVVLMAAAGMRRASSRPPPGRSS